MLYILLLFFFYTKKRTLFLLYITTNYSIAFTLSLAFFASQFQYYIPNNPSLYIYIYILMIFIYSSLSSTLILQTFFIIKQSSQFPSSFIHFPHACNSNIQIASFIPFNSCYYYYYIGFTIFFFYPLNTILNIGSKDLLSIFKICRKLK